MEVPDKVVKDKTSDVISEPQQAGGDSAQNSKNEEPNEIEDENKAANVTLNSLPSSSQDVVDHQYEDLQSQEAKAPDVKRTLNDLSEIHVTDMDIIEDSTILPSIDMEQDNSMTLPTLDREQVDELKLPIIDLKKKQGTNDSVIDIEKEACPKQSSNSNISFDILKDSSSILENDKEEIRDEPSNLSGNHNRLDVLSLRDDTSSRGSEVESWYCVDSAMENGSNTSKTVSKGIGIICDEEEFHTPASTDVERSVVGNVSRVTLKRKTDSLAMISCYQISSDEDEDESNRNSFIRHQPIIHEINSSSDSDSGSDFNLDSEDASNESSDSSGEEGADTQEVVEVKTKKQKPKTGYDEELPPIKDLHISVKEDECLPFGKVHSIVECLVVIEALPDVPALNLDSVLFSKLGQPLGEIFDVFGPVKRPYYTIRFKSRNAISEKSLQVGSQVYCAPKTKYTQYVFIHQLATLKGSDASWRNDGEVPPEYAEYSDDEQERVARKVSKEAKIKAKVSQIIDLDAPPRKLPTFEERMNQRNILRNQLYIKNSTPEGRRKAEWFRSTVRENDGAVGTAGGSLMRAAQFTPPAFQRPCAPSTSGFTLSGPNRSLCSPPNLGSHPFPVRSQIFSRPFPPHVMRPGMFSPPNNHNYVNSNQFLPNRMPFGQNNQNFQMNSFPTGNSSFPQNNLFQQCSSPFQQSSSTFQQGSQAFKQSSPPFKQSSPNFSRAPNNLHNSPHMKNNSQFSTSLQSSAFNQCPRPFHGSSQTYSSPPPSQGPFQQHPFSQNGPYMPFNNQPFHQNTRPIMPNSPPFAVHNNRPPPFPLSNNFSFPQANVPQFHQNKQFYSPPNNAPQFPVANNNTFTSNTQQFKP